ncbi:MAG TPA: polyprenyl synthetase family protein [Candidatus Acidoferrales bacterium]|nr:polyprenyl synthetase family protein [Candidatus Acidoferrales bacterium]
MSTFQKLLEDKRALVNKRIDDLLSTGFEQSEANELVKYTFRTGGKRLRPILVLLACDTVGGNSDHALDAAAAMEFVHAASLIFDDLIDKHRLRRSLPTTQHAFADDKAISAGLFLASKGVQILSEYKDPRITRLVGWGLVDLSKGEILDTLTELAIDIEHYLNIADLKTASLFSAAAGIGGVLGGANAHDVNCLYNYGRAVGIAFQIKDDILDQSADPVRQERMNLVVMHYLDEATRRERVSNLLENSEKSDNPQIAELYEQALQFALKKSREHVEKAKSELKTLHDPSKAKVLEDFADYSLERSF